MKWLSVSLALLLLGLQWRLWVGESSLAEVRSLQQQVAVQKAENQRLDERNRQLEAEVRDLKQGLGAIEERARSELGMVRQGETFFLLVDETTRGSRVQAE